MKKLILLAFLLNLNLIYGQKAKTTTIVKEFSVKTDDLETLRKFDWQKVKNGFKDNKESDSIKIGIQYNNNKLREAGIPNMDNVAVEIKGQKSELRKMIRTARKLSKQIVKSEKDT